LWWRQDRLRNENQDVKMRWYVVQARDHVVQTRDHDVIAGLQGVIADVIRLQTRLLDVQVDDHDV
jgi:hypothetical protein